MSLSGSVNHSERRARAALRKAAQGLASSLTSEDIEAVWAYVDARGRAGAGEGGDGPPHDLLFDILMSRFDVMQDDRDAFIAILKELRTSPCGVKSSAAALSSSAADALDYAGLPSGGVMGHLHRVGLGAVIAAAMRAWIQDESEDMSAVMAEIDRRLSQAETIARTLRLVADHTDKGAAA